MFCVLCCVFVGYMFVSFNVYGCLLLIDLLCDREVCGMVAVAVCLGAYIYSNSLPT